MADQDEIAFREMFPLVIGALIALTVLLVIVALVIDARTREDIYVPSGQTRTETLQERLAPVGQVQFGGPEEVAVAESEEPAEPRAGSAVYDAICAACHDTGAADAPMLDAADAWRSRLDERGYDGILESVIGGRGAMPPRGGGGDSVSDEELERAVEYILDEAGVSW